MIAERSAVSIGYPDPDSRRPAVVLQVFREVQQAIVILGTKQDHVELAGLKAGLCVGPGDLGFDALGLADPTYFYPTNVGSAPLDELTVRGSRCPPTLFLSLREIMERAFRLPTELPWYGQKAEPQY